MEIYHKQVLAWLVAHGGLAMRQGVLQVAAGVVGMVLFMLFGWIFICYLIDESIGGPSVVYQTESERFVYCEVYDPTVQDFVKKDWDWFLKNKDQYRWQYRLAAPGWALAKPEEYNFPPEQYVPEAHDHLRKIAAENKSRDRL